MNHFDYTDADRGISEEALYDHPQFVLAEDGHVLEATTGEVVV